LPPLGEVLTLRLMLPYDYSQESEIVWLMNPLQFHYLREEVTKMSFRARPPSKTLVRTPNILIGYVNLKPNAKSATPGRFLRRYWWLMGRDVTDGTRL